MQLSPNHWSEIERSISSESGGRFKIRAHTSIGGGCISSAWRVEGGDQTYFVKLNDASLLDMFVSEAEGLRELSTGAGPRVPAPVCHGLAGDQSFLVLECIEFGSSSVKTEQLLGEQLASMHQVEKSYFGWHRDNHIGATPQRNASSNNWASFFAKQRLRPQLKLAASNGFNGEVQDLGDELIEYLPDLFSDHRPASVVLHGDIWGGNHGVDTDGRPVIFDPAVYFGDRETDLAMTELFGGFSVEFYAAYNSVLPLDVGYDVRRSLYNLYHIINHVNLFGAGYLEQALTIQKRLLSELR